MEFVVDAVQPNELVEVKQATICMIDICGFSKWCTSRMPHKIVDTMNEYYQRSRRHVSGAYQD